MRGREAAAPAPLLLSGAAVRAQAVLAPKGNLADLLALFFRDDLQGWAGRRNPAARSWLREPQLRALVDANLAKCLARLRDAAPDPAPAVRPGAPLAPPAACLAYACWSSDAAGEARICRAVWAALAVTC